MPACSPDAEVASTRGSAEPLPGNLKVSGTDLDLRLMPFHRASPTVPRAPNVKQPLATAGSANDLIAQPRYASASRRRPVREFHL